jgi:hypothetical protein
VKFLPTGQNLINCSTIAGTTQKKDVTAGSSPYSLVLAGLESNAQFNVAIVPYTNGGNIAGKGANIQVNTAAAGENVIDVLALVFISLLPEPSYFELLRNT